MAHQDHAGWTGKVKETKQSRRGYGTARCRQSLLRFSVFEKWNEEYGERCVSGADVPLPPMRVCGANLTRSGECPNAHYHGQSA